MALSDTDAKMHPKIAGRQANGGFDETGRRYGLPGRHRTGACGVDLWSTWVNLTVGIAENEESPVNLSFFVMVMIAVVAAFAAEFRARSMARVMFSVAAIADDAGSDRRNRARFGTASRPDHLGLIALNGFFALLWMISARFARAATSWDYELADDAGLSCPAPRKSAARAPAARSNSQAPTDR